MTRVDLPDETWLAVLAAVEMNETEETDEALARLLRQGLDAIRKAVGL